MRSMTWGVGAALVVLAATARGQTMVDLTAAQGVSNAAGATSGTSASRIINDVRAHVPSPKAGWSEPSDGTRGGGKSAWVTAGDLGGRRNGGGGRNSWATRATGVAHAGDGRSAWVHAADPNARQRR